LYERSKAHDGNGCIRYGDYGDLNISVININLSITIICKNVPSVINVSNNITSILYFCKTLFYGLLSLAQIF